VVVKSEHRDAQPNWLDLLNYVKNEGKKDGSVQRYKGLGEMNAEQLAETTMNPAKRTLLQVGLEDAVECEEPGRVNPGSRRRSHRAIVAYERLPVPPTLTQLTERLMESYARAGGINHVDGKNLPSKHAIAEITADLLRLLFPGFFDETPIHFSEIEAVTRALLDSVLERLENEIGKSLEYAPPPGLESPHPPDMARTLTLKFLGNLPRVRELLRTDTEAAYNGDPAAFSKEEVIVAYPCIEAIAVQRLAHELYLDNIPLIPRIMTEWAHARTGMDLHPGARIGTHFFVDHCTGTVVGETAVIGNHVKMYQGVGLVAKSLAAGQALRGQKRHPTIGDRVTVYAGATIMGGDTVIGEGSTIGASVFLTTSVPANSLVVLEAANVRVISKTSHEGYALDYQI
jgi:serine O-acetyltransferase